MSGVHKSDRPIQRCASVRCCCVVTMRPRLPFHSVRLRSAQYLAAWKKGRLLRLSFLTGDKSRECLFVAAACWIRLPSPQCGLGVRGSPTEWIRTRNPALDEGYEALEDQSCVCSSLIPGPLPHWGKGSRNRLSFSSDNQFRHHNLFCGPQ